MVMDAVAVLLLIALAAGLARIALRCPRGPFRTVSAGGGAMFLLLAISSLHHLLILAAGKNLITSHWLDWLHSFVVSCRCWPRWAVSADWLPIHPAPSFPASTLR